MSAQTMVNVTQLWPTALHPSPTYGMVDQAVVCTRQVSFVVGSSLNCALAKEWPPNLYTMVNATQLWPALHPHHLMACTRLVVCTSKSACVETIFGLRSGSDSESYLSLTFILVGPQHSPYMKEVLQLLLSCLVTHATQLPQHTSHKHHTSLPTKQRPRSLLV